MTKRLPPSVRYLYVIGPIEGLQKVGIATDPRVRLATLQTANPYDLILHFTVSVPFGEALNIERRAHRLLARCCVRNEWFETTPAEAIAAVKQAVVRRQGSGTGAADVRRTQRQGLLLVDRAPLMQFGARAAHQPSGLPLFSFAGGARPD